MTCEASGDPKPNVHWITKYGQRINGNMLNFTNINRSDAGQYRCEAENDCGSDSRVKTVKVNCKYEVTLHQFTRLTKRHGMKLWHGRQIKLLDCHQRKKKKIFEPLTLSLPT